MEENFSSVSKWDMSVFSNEDIRKEIKRRENIQIFLMAIVTLVLLLFYIIFTSKIVGEKGDSFLILMLIMGIDTMIYIILGEIKPLYTGNLKLELKKRKKKRKIQEILALMEKGCFSIIEIDEDFQQEIFQIFLECGAIKMTPTPEENVKISVLPSFEATEVLEISNNQVLKYFSL